MNQNKLGTPDLHIWFEQTFGHAITQSKERKPKLKIFCFKEKMNLSFSFYMTVMRQEISKRFQKVCSKKT